MATTITQVNTASGGDVFQTLFNRVNETINAISTQVVTANSAANGSITTGNAFIVGILGANTIVVPTALRGGNVQSSDVLTITSNVNITGALINVGSFSVNSTIARFTSNITMTTTSLTIGNSSVNVFANSSTLRVGGVNTALVTERSAVAYNTSVTYARTKLNFIQGTNIALTVTDDEVGGQVNVEIAASSTDTPAAGANTQVQFNDGESFGGNANFTFNKTSQTLYVSNTVNSPKWLANNNFQTEALQYTSSNTDAQVIDSFFHADFRGGEYLLSIKNNEANGFHMLKLLVLFDGSATQATEYGTLISNSSLGSFATTSNSTHVILNFTPTNENTTIKGSKTLLGA